MASVSFETIAPCGRTHARRGKLHTAHGVVDTPVFMPVGTLGAVKSLDVNDLDGLGVSIMLQNAYHLMLRPGPERIAQAGGLHDFTGNKRAVLTDSGGFQAFSLSPFRKITDEGVDFRSHIDGSMHHLTPKRLVEVQELLAPDIAMVIDECPPGEAEESDVEKAVQRTARWAQACHDARKRDDVAFFGIVQGGTYPILRKRSVEEICAIDFEGFAIGGVSVGEAPEEIQSIVDLTAPMLPAQKPRYLMGVGTPQDLVRGVASGVDMFDCVMPSRNARNGQLFTSQGRIVIKHAEHAQSDESLDPQCPCHTCTTYSRGFLRHLFMAKELTYFRLATLHNVRFYLRLMTRMRDAIEQGRFDPAAMLKELGG